MARIRVRGMDALQEALKDTVTLDDVKRVVSKNGEELQIKMKENADFTRGYATGTTKRSIGVKELDKGFTVEVGPETNYSPYLEHGTRFMTAQPFVRPAYEEQKKKFLSDMKKLVR